MDLSNEQVIPPQQNEFKYYLPDGIPVLKGQLLSIHWEGPPSVAFEQDKVSRTLASLAAFK